MFLRVPVLSFLFLARMGFSKNESISSIAKKRYIGEVLKALRKFEKVDYKLREVKLDINFLVKCQNENIIPNFHKFCWGSENRQNSVVKSLTNRNL